MAFQSDDLIQSNIYTRNLSKATGFVTDLLKRKKAPAPIPPTPAPTPAQRGLTLLPKAPAPKAPGQVANGQPVQQPLAPPPIAPKPITKLGVSSSIVDYLRGRNQPFDFNTRSKMFRDAGLETTFGSFVGSATQNTALLKKLQGQEQTAATAPTAPGRISSAISTLPELPTGEAPGAPQGETAVDEFGRVAGEIAPEFKSQFEQATADVTGELARGEEVTKREIGDIKAASAEELAVLPEEIDAARQQTISELANRNLSQSGFKLTAEESLRKAEAAARARIPKEEREKILKVLEGAETKFGTEFLKNLGVPEASEFAVLPAAVRGSLLKEFGRQTETIREKMLTEIRRTTEREEERAFKEAEITGLFKGKPTLKAKQVALDAENEQTKLELQERSLQRQEQALELAIQKEGRTAAHQAASLGIQRAKLGIAQQALTRATKIETSLRQEFLKQTEEFVTIRDSFGRLKASAESPSAAGDIALIFNYMKILDPKSVVREAEFATAANAGGVPDKTRALYNKVVDGKRLSQRQRKDFVGSAEELFNQQKLQADKLSEQYKNLTLSAGGDPLNVVLDIGLEGGFDEETASLLEGE